MQQAHELACSLAKSMVKVGSCLQGSQITLGNENKLSLSKPDRNPTLPEKIDIVNKWFASCVKDNKDQFKSVDVPIEKIAELFVQKQLVSDIDTGIKLILKSLNMRTLPD